MAWFIKKLYAVFKLFKWYRRLYRRKAPPSSDRAALEATRDETRS